MENPTAHGKLELLTACKEWFVEHGVRQGLILINMALSFSHIHDLALHNGQALWQADLYPAAIDAVQAYALHKMRTPRLDALATAISWTVFLLFCGISLAANLLDAPVHSLTGYFVAVLPALALVVVTAMGHLHPAPQPVIEHAHDEQTERPARKARVSADGKPRSKRAEELAVITKALAEFRGKHPNGTGKAFAWYANDVLERAGFDKRSERTLQNTFYGKARKPAVQRTSIN